MILQLKGTVFEKVDCTVLLKIASWLTDPKARKIFEKL